MFMQEFRNAIILNLRNAIKLTIKEPSKEHWTLLNDMLNIAEQSMTINEVKDVVLDERNSLRIALL